VGIVAGNPYPVKFIHNKPEATDLRFENILKKMSRLKMDEWW